MVIEDEYGDQIDQMGKAKEVRVRPKVDIVLVFCMICRLQTTWYTYSDSLISYAGDSPRSGASMAIFKNRAVLFGGVYDEDVSEEKLESTFYNEL